MRERRNTCWVATFAGAGVLWGTIVPAWAGEVRMTTRTIGEAYVIRVPGTSGAMLTRRRIAQYVDLGVYRLLPPKSPGDLVRAPEDGQLQVVTSLRLRHDFGTFTREATGLARNLVGSLDERQVDLLMGYLEGRGLAGRVDFRFGRQIDLEGFDFFAFDGGWLRVRTPGHFALEVSGGLVADGGTALGVPTFGLDGRAPVPTTPPVSPWVGAAIALDGLRWVDARLAYRRIWAPASTDDAFDGGGVHREFLTLSAGVRLAGNRVHPHAAARYNLGTGVFDDVSAGVRWVLTPLHAVRLDYLRTLPTFDLDSIFNVFSVEPFEEARVAYEVRPGPRWTLLARGHARRFHDAGPNAWGGGGSAAAHYRGRWFAIRIDGFGLGGEGGTRVGGRIDTRTHVVYDRLALDGRVWASYDRDREDPRRDGVQVAIQAGVNLELASGVALDVMAEELVSPQFESALRLFGALTFDWAFRVGRRP